jgi:hypothetical protein
MITLLIDADACPVKQEAYRVAERHLLKGVAIKVFVVSNSPIAVLAPHAFDICTPMGYNLQCLGAQSRLLNSPAIVGAPMIS